MNLRSISRGIDAINFRIGRSVSWLTLVMVLVTVTDVILRYLLNTGAVFIQELEWHLFGFVFLLSAGYTLLDDAHVRVDIFYANRSVRTKAWIDLFGTLVFLFPMCVMIVWASQKFIWNSFQFLEGSPDPGGLPARYIIKSMIPLGFALVALQGVSEVIRNVLVLMDEEKAE